jgi:hypothetical protein
VVFLFMVHPFDVGDTLMVSGDTHKVRSAPARTALA